jgi:hypothetical protein
MVPGRLAKNRPLHLQLEQGLTLHFESKDYGQTWEQALQVPFDAPKLLRLYEYMAQGLSLWHWGIYLPPETCEIHATFVIPEMEALFDRMLAVAVAHKVTGDLSEGVLKYTGIQDPNTPQLTVWSMSLYETILGRDPKSPTHTPQPELHRQLFRLWYARSGGCGTLDGVQYQPEVPTNARTRSVADAR